MSGYTDIHTHFVYGVDDGARTKRDMEAMLEAGYTDGITILLVTPHVMPEIAPLIGNCSSSD